MLRNYQIVMVDFYVVLEISTVHTWDIKLVNCNKNDEQKKLYKVIDKEVEND